jgi:MFS family permease
MVLSGELLGAGVGLVLSADIGDVAGWRAAFFVLAVPSVVLAYLLKRLLPEPARGGQSWLRRGDEEIKPAEELGQNPDGTLSQEVVRGGADVPAPPIEDSEVRRKARQRKDIEPRPALVLERDPLEMSSWAASTYVVRIPSNVVLIAASVLGYFFLAGLRSFAVLFAESHYQISQAAVTLVLIPVGVGAVLGTLVGGRIVDRLIRKGKIDARITVSAIAFLAATVLLLPSLLSSLLFVSIPLYTLAAACLTAPNPALDAARLDVVPSRLWGRGEAVRTFSELVLEAFAPLIFGYVSMQFGGPGANLGPGVNGRAAEVVSTAQGRGLEYTFIVMLVPLLAAGLVLLVSRRRYLRDVATADVSDRTLRNLAIQSVEAERADGATTTPAAEAKAFGGPAGPLSHRSER